MSAPEIPDPPATAEPPAPPPEPEPSWRCRRGHVIRAPQLLVLTVGGMQVGACAPCVVEYVRDKFGVQRWREVPAKARD